jgi:hypothetical protein
MFIRKSAFVAVLATALLAVGCAGQKGPADEAIKAAETALAAVKEDAAKYVPSELAGVESSLTALKDSFAKGDYKAVLAGAGGVTGQINALKDAAMSKKAEVEAAIAQATTDWAAMSADLPKMVDAIQSRVDILGKARKLPKGMDQATFDGAKSGLEMMKSVWGEATAAATSGNVLDAVAKGQQVKDKGAEVMAALGMSAG